MRKSRFTEEQIIRILKEQEAGQPTAAVCRQHGICESTFYKWKAKYGGMEVADAKRLKALAGPQKTKPIKQKTSYQQSRWHSIRAFVLEIGLLYAGYVALSL